MRLIDNRTGLESIEREECLRLLRHGHVGRVGVIDGGRPVVLPVNYAMDGDRVVFRTAGGTKFDAAVRGATVAFEIDGADPMFHTGWSVLVSGRAEEVTDEGDRDRIDALGLQPWAAGDKPHVVSVSTATVTGRRIIHVADWQSGV
jgi:nitroimidazol reductase NimA-like FMN-containing flavoprotein (pyridoxamine 5'-phosphate oxidase superfamily)